MSPVTVQDVPSVAEQPGRSSAVPAMSRTLTSYDVIGDPPSDFDAFHDTTALASPAVATAFRGPSPSSAVW